jgi:quercetin dioxygenase-like cupin family protein
VLTAHSEGFHAREIRADADTGVLLLSDEPGANAVLVLDGELRLRLDGDERLLERGTWAFVPASLDHSLATGSRPARFLHVRVESGPSRDVIVRRAGGSEGDRITDRPERRATVLVEADEITISEFHYGPGQRGAQRHVHREHADAFLVLEGELTIHLRDGSQALPAGTLVVLPPGVVHGFDNDSDSFMRCFNFHMPSLGFADYMRGRNPGFDQLVPPEDGGVDPAVVVLAHLSE